MRCTELMLCQLYRLVAGPSHKALTVLDAKIVFVQVDQWLDFSDAIISGAGLEAVCGVVDQFLSL